MGVSLRLVRQLVLHYAGKRAYVRVFVIVSVFLETVGVGFVFAMKRDMFGFAGEGRGGGEEEKEKT